MIHRRMFLAQRGPAAATALFWSDASSIAYMRIYYTDPRDVANELASLTGYVQQKLDKDGARFLADVQGYQDYDQVALRRHVARRREAAGVRFDDVYDVVSPKLRWGQRHVFTREYYGE